MAFNLPSQSAAIGQGQARAQQLAALALWTPDDTEKWLTDYPLPAAFMWNGARAYPKYRLKKGYGFWLRTAGPYHAALRGLFALCHEILANLRPGVDLMPTPEQLAALLNRQAHRQGSLELTAEDKAAPLPENPAENVPTFDPPPASIPPANEYPANPDDSEEPAF